MSPPLSEPAYNVLRALVLGFELRGGATGWSFAGSPHGAASSAAMSELLAGGFVEYRVALTEAGLRACHLRTQETMETALHWVLGEKKRLKELLDS